MNSEREQFELLLSQHGDGTLTDAERAAVTAALASDTSLAESARGYQRLAELLTRIRAERIRCNENELSHAVREALHVEMEFLISQNLDGGLTPAEASQLKRSIAATPELAVARDAMTSLNGLLRARAADVPAVDMKALTGRIRSQVMREKVREGVAGHRLRWMAYGAPMALAAAVALAVLLSRTPNGGLPVPPLNAAPMVAVNIAVPQRAPGGRVDVTFDHNEPAEFARAREELRQPESGLVRDPRPTEPGSYEAPASQEKQRQKSIKTSLKALY